MNLQQLITPKHDDGSLNHRYVPIAKSIVSLAGERVEVQLRKLFIGTHNLEKESASAGLQLVIALFSIPMDERYERSKLKKHIREQLQEIGFKPSKVSKLMGAGEFYSKYKNYSINSDFDVETTEAEFNDKRERFLDEYFSSVAKLYELSRMHGGGVEKVKQDFLIDNKVYTQAELEKLVISYPKDEYERKGRKTSRTNFPETRPTHALAAHDSLEVMDDAKEEAVVEQPESGQRLVTQFFHFLASGEMDRCLAGFAPAAQTHMIDEVQAVQSLLEDFISKHQPIEVTPIH